MARDVSDTTPIGARSELVDWIASGEKPRDTWRLGTEHEKIPFYTADASPVPYEGGRGIRALLEGLRERTSWAPIIEGERATFLFRGEVDEVRVRHRVVGLPDPLSA